MQQMLKTSESIKKEIHELYTSKNYMNDAEIHNQEEILTKKRKLVADMEQNLSKAKKIKARIITQEKSRSNLDEKTIESLHQKIERAKKAMSSQVDANSCSESLTAVLNVQQEARCELECVICLAIPPGEVFSCNNDHILCSGCNIKVTVCPLCRINFEETPARRNRLAEKLIQKLT